MDMLLLSLRILLAAVFLVAGLTTFADLPGSQRTFRHFGLSTRLAALLGRLLPLADLVVAIALLPSALAWGGELGALALLLLFVGGISFNLARGRTLDCPGFGQWHSAPAGWLTLLRTLEFSALAGVIIGFGRSSMSLSTLDWIVRWTMAQRAELLGFLLLLGGLAGAGWLMRQIQQQQRRFLLRLKTLEASPETRDQPRTVPMKIAYLILAHKNPVHLTRLISALQTEHAHIFIHIDKRSQVFLHVPETSTVTVLKKTIPVNWGGFSIVQATLRLMQEARAHGEYDYFILLSGADYPVKSTAALFQFLQQQESKEFLNLWKMPELHKPFSRVEDIYIEHALGVVLSSPVKRVINRATRDINKALRAAHIKRKYPQLYAHFTLYAGSTWWGLSKSGVDYILQFVTDNPAYVAFYKHTFMADEMFFHTILGNSPFLKRIAPTLMYDDWVTGSPATITFEHLPILAQHTLPSVFGREMTPFFARKFSDISQELITEIAHLLRNDDEQAESGVASLPRTGEEWTDEDRRCSVTTSSSPLLLSSRHQREEEQDSARCHKNESPAKTPMKVSCICPTYNRAPDYLWLLEEAIESFLRQDYPEKELIVLNDCPGQELVCDVPRVVVVNVSRRFRSLGEKLNAGMALASGSLLTNWDDDDISLPWRLSSSVERLAEADYYNPHVYWFLDPNGLHADHRMGVCQNCSLFRRSAFDAVNGYPHVSGNNDWVIDQRLRSHPEVKQAEPASLRVDEWFYIYRWGVSPVHLSGNGDPDSWSNFVGQKPVVQGQYVLRPHWKEEYVRSTRNAIGISDIASYKRTPNA